MSYRKVTVSTAMRQIRNGELVLPAIQRDFVWAPERIYLFLDSLMRGYPIGTLLFWNTKQHVQYREFDKCKTDDMHYTYHIKPEGKRGTMVLDGQQRLQSLYLALEGELDGKRLYFNILSDLNDEVPSEVKSRFEFLSLQKTVARNERLKRSEFWVPLNEIYRCKDIPERHRLVERYIARADIDRSSAASHRLAENVEIAHFKLKAEEILNHYTIDPDYGEDSPPTPIHEILEIFVRVNSGGQVLSKSDLMFSLMQLHWEGAAESIDGLLDELNAAGQFDFDKDFVLRCALVCCGRGARYDVDKLRDEATVAQIETEFPRIVHALTSCVDLLVMDARILDGRILGSYNSLIPFVYFLYHQDQQVPRDESTRRAMKHALYLSLTTSVFARYADSRIDGIVREVLSPAERTSPGIFPLEQFRAFVGRREGRDRIDNWLLQRNISLLMNILEGGSVLPSGRRRYRPEVDHIFPVSKLEPIGYDKEKIDDFANLRLISKRDNRWKSNMDPKDYFQAKPGVAEQYLIPTDLLDYEQYDAFLIARRRKIWERIKVFLGLTDDDLPSDDRLVPGEEDTAIDQLEGQLRDLIQNSLAEVVGEGYWKRAIPSQVQQGVKTRINEHLSRHPEQSWHDYATGRSRLDFCDFSDYEVIILAKQNWPLFEQVFRRHGEFERHMSAVRRFRNCVKHRREIDTVERLNGEAGILWLRRVLEPVKPSDSTDQGPDEPTPEDFQRILSRIPVPRGQKQLYRALYDAGAKGLIQDELVKVMGRRDRSDLAGVLGALGKRINGTSGYGQTEQPGTAMVLSVEKTHDGQYRYRLLPAMRAALEMLDPSWLREMTP
jgi:hypothetical protein